MRKVLVSACLLGEKVRYDGASRSVASEVLARWERDGRIVRVCPEVLGGLPVPRPPAERRPDGRVVDDRGVDRSDEFHAGARLALLLAREHEVACAVLKERSPSCGSHEVYDGSFSGRRVPGEGVTAAALRAAGFTVFSEDELAQADALLSP